MAYEFRQKPGEEGYQVFSGPDGYLAADAHGGLPIEDARLFAAAPELLSALKDACEEIRELRHFANNNGGMFDEQTFSEGLAAIARAEGGAS